MRVELALDILKDLGVVHQFVSDDKEPHARIVDHAQEGGAAIVGIRFVGDRHDYDVGERHDIQHSVEIGLCFLGGKIRGVPKHGDRCGLGQDGAGSGRGRSGEGGAIAMACQVVIGLPGRMVLR